MTGGPHLSAEEGRESLTGGAGSSGGGARAGLRLLSLLLGLAHLGLAADFFCSGLFLFFVYFLNS